MERVKIKFCLLLAAASCTQEAVGLASPYTSPPSSTNWLDVPWPSDLRRNDQGRPRLFSYPDPQATELVRAAIALAETRSGFALQPTIYVEMGAPVAAEQLAVDPEAALDAAAAVQLLALDGLAQRRPLALGQGGADDWISPTTLHARPLFGWPLNPGQRYALVITKGLKPAQTDQRFQPVPEIAQALNSAGPQAAFFKPLSDRLADYGLQPEQVLTATLFTTANPTAEMAALSEAQSALPTPTLDSSWQPTDPPSPRVYEAHYSAPLWQHGAKPYSSSGGGFVFDRDVPQISTSNERMRLAIMIPRGEPPEDGWPIVLYQHGTGGDYRSFLDSSGS